MVRPGRARFGENRVATIDHWSRSSPIAFKQHFDSLVHQAKAHALRAALRSTNSSRPERLWVRNDLLPLHALPVRGTGVPARFLRQ